MSSPLINTPQALDEAIAASRQSRREKLVRAIRNQRIRTRVAFALAAFVFLLAFVAFFVAHDLRAAMLLLMIGTVTSVTTAAAGNAGRKKSLNLLQEMDQAN
jgi:fatty acid desaturase